MTLKPTLAVLALIGLAVPDAALANQIERACIKSDRGPVSRAMCGCIQDVANLYLGNSDQKLAAKFFKDPHAAQEIRQSDRHSHEAFWQRYKKFGATASSHCSSASN